MPSRKQDWMAACLVKAEGSCSHVPDDKLDVAHLRDQLRVLSPPPQQPRQPLHGHHMLSAPAQHMRMPYHVGCFLTTKSLVRLLCAARYWLHPMAGVRDSTV